MAEFETRLLRARPDNRVQYLRVKAATLLSLSDAEATRTAIGLLHRVVDSSNHFLEVPFSHELLGGAYRHLGDLESAEHHLRCSMATADDRRNGLSLPELTLAEVLLDRGRVSDARSVLGALQEIERSMPWNAQLFRFAVAMARCEHRSDGDATAWALRALDYSDITKPQLSRHPTVGLVQADSETLDEMTRLAAPTEQLGLMGTLRMLWRRRVRDSRFSYYRGQRPPGDDRG